MRLVLAAASLSLIPIGAQACSVADAAVLVSSDLEDLLQAPAIVVGEAREHFPAARMVTVEDEEIAHPVEILEQLSGPRIASLEGHFRGGMCGSDDERLQLGIFFVHETGHGWEVVRRFDPPVSPGSIRALKLVLSAKLTGDRRADVALLRRLGKGEPKEARALLDALAEDHERTVSASASYEELADIFERFDGLPRARALRAVTLAHLQNGCDLGIKAFDPDGQHDANEEFERRLILQEARSATEALCSPRAVPALLGLLRRRPPFASAMEIIGAALHLATSDQRGLVREMRAVVADRDDMAIRLAQIDYWLAAHPAP